MEKRIRCYHTIAAVLLFVILPVLLWAISDVPRRSWLKEGLSLLTLVSFSVVLLQFYMSKINKGMIKHHKFSKVLKWHKVLGYVFITILTFHPFFIVLPRYFESGVAPSDAFRQLLSTYTNPSVLMGMVAWCLMLVLGLSALFRNQLPMSYKVWTIFHGIVSALFIAAATYHIINLGRHSSPPMQLFFLILSGFALVLLINSYLFNTKIESHE